MNEQMHAIGVGSRVNYATIRRPRIAFWAITSPSQPNQFGRACSMFVKSVSAGTLNPLPGANMASLPQDQLRSVRQIDRSSVELTFADDFTAKITEKQIGVTEKLNMETAKATPNGLIFRTNNRRKIVIDSATLRYLVDAKYAINIDNAIAALHIPIRVAQKATSGPIDPRWNDVGDEDDLFE